MLRNYKEACWYRSEPDSSDKYLSGPSRFRILSLTFDPGSKVSEKALQVDLLVLAQLEVMQSEGGAKFKAFYGGLSARVYRRLEAAPRPVAVDAGAKLTLN